MVSLFRELRNYWSMVAQAFPPKPTFSTEQIPELDGKVAIVTGGNTGIGRETVKALLERNARVYLAARTPSKAHAAIDKLKAETGKEAIFLQLDLASLDSVKKASEDFLSKEAELHILFNNAGVAFPSIDMLTEDGYDLQFGTNVLGHYYLTSLLLPALISAAKSSPDRHARIVHTSSSGAYGATIDHTTLKDKAALVGRSRDEQIILVEQVQKRRRRVMTHNLYSQSKLGNAIMAREFARRYADQGIISISCNPGNLDSELFRNIPTLNSLMTILFLYPVQLGALTQLWAGTMPEALNYNGEFLIPWARVGRCREEVYDAEVGGELWSWLERQVRL